jgi:ketosteroid isomerase-like protein
MSTATNKAIVLRWVKAVNENNPAEMDALLAPALAEEWKNVTLPWLYSTFANHHIEITELLAEYEKVAIWGDTSGVHTGEVEGLVPTGRSWTNKGVFLLRLHEGKIVEARGLFDNLNLIRQFGITGTPAAS